ncbi:hypothetical protein [Brevibacillus centrosporus]|jgi:hypothetical protein|uniref:hypothetical protein n=1 Tax=Brevibacillus TaxID=55080 RepID=UPI0011671D9B|nr:hypothetical protein [Brevibacillus centrosporus]MEC2129322.1 hypothetical protein [Brevibacillus centrosporus]GED33488.1 hypothetical protein BCE02nite_46290 [Brevibacillus centrosporus]
MNTALKPNSIKLPHYKETLAKEAQRNLEFFQEREKRAAEIMARAGLSVKSSK